MLNINEIHPQYITDENGNKRSVILSISDYEELLEDIEDLASMTERRNEPSIKYKDVLIELKKDGLI